MSASCCVLLLKLKCRFFLSSGAENVERVLVTVIQGAVEYPDPTAQKTCFIILSKLVELWGEDILSTRPSPPPHAPVPGQEPKALWTLVNGLAVGSTSSPIVALTNPSFPDPFLIQIEAGAGSWFSLTWTG